MVKLYATITTVETSGVVCFGIANASRTQDRRQEGDDGFAQRKFLDTVAEYQLMILMFRLLSPSVDEGVMLKKLSRPACRGGDAESTKQSRSLARAYKPFGQAGPFVQLRWIFDLDPLIMAF